MKAVYRLLADVFFVLHFVIGAFFLFGWIFSEIQIVYLPLLISWPLSWILLGYCPVTKWEFLLRRKYGANLDTNTEFIRHYTHKFFQIKIPPRPIFTGGFSVFIALIVLYFVSL